MIKLRVFLSVIFLLVSNSCTNPHSISDTRMEINSSLEVPAVSIAGNKQIDSNNQKQPESTIFAGNMSGGYVQMMLKREGEKLTGTYFLTYSPAKNVAEFKLTGKIDTEGNFVLTETNSQGAFTDEISGTWLKDGDDDGYTSYIKLRSPTKRNFDGGAIFAQEQKIFFNGPAKFGRKDFDQNFGDFIFTAGEYAELSGVANADKFNRAVKSIIDRQVNDFRKDYEKAAESDRLTANLWISYNIEHADENIISIGFEGKTLYQGAAHSNEYNFTLNYDLKAGRIIKLTDLFKPKSQYLQRISAYCDQKYPGIGFEAEAKVYRAWSLTRRGLLIKFDPYEITSYAAGTQKIMVPFSDLEGLLKENGPADLMINN